MNRTIIAVLSSSVCFGLGWLTAGRTPEKSGAGDRDPGNDRFSEATLPERVARGGGRVSSLRPGAIREIVEDFLHTDWSDHAAMVGSVGRVAGLTDPEVREAWESLVRRVPGNSHSEQVLAVYLWSRMARLAPGVVLPAEWLAVVNPEAVSMETVRQSMDAIAERLRSGALVPEADRRAFFAEMIKQDARAALDFWFEVSKPLEHIGEIGLFSGLLRDPSTRQATLDRIRVWSSEKIYVDELITSMAQPWIVADPAGSGVWIDSLDDPELRQRLVTKLAVAQGAGNPREAFQWSACLPLEQRIAARSMSANQLAYNDPATGIELIASVEDGTERGELVKSFSNMLAMQDVGRWVDWRDSLPDAERQLANKTGFGSWAVHEPAAAADWLMKQEPGHERDMMAAELVRITAANETTTAIEWINRIENPSERMMAISMALGNLTHGDTTRMKAILDAAAAN